MLGDGLFRRYLVTTTILMMAGYAALNTGFVAFATSVAKAGPGTIAAAFAANTGFIVLAQPLALRIVSRTRRTTALKLVAAAFAACWVVLAFAGLVPGSSAARALVIATMVVFAVGEVLLSPVSGPLVNNLAPLALRGRYFAASAMCITVANVVSPAISGAAIGAGLGIFLLGFFVACCGVAALGAHWLGRALHAGTGQRTRDPVTGLRPARRRTGRSRSMRPAPRSFASLRSPTDSAQPTIPPLVMASTSRARSTSSSVSSPISSTTVRRSLPPATAVFTTLAACS